MNKELLGWLLLASVPILIFLLMERLQGWIVTIMMFAFVTLLMALIVIGSILISGG